MLHTEPVSQMHAQTLVDCCLPALKFIVVDVSKFLFAVVGYPVSQKFNEVQSGFKRINKRRHVDVLQAAVVADYRLTERRKFIC